MKLLFSNMQLFQSQFQKGWEGWILFLITINVSQSYSATISSTHSGKCRARSGLLNQDAFAVLTCADCYTYLFPTGKELKAHQGWLVSLNGTVYPHMHFLVPDVHNATSVNQVCETLNR